MGGVHANASSRAEGGRREVFGFPEKINGKMVAVNGLIIQNLNNEPFDKGCWEEVPSAEGEKIVSLRAKQKAFLEGGRFKGKMSWSLHIRRVI